MDPEIEVGGEGLWQEAEETAQVQGRWGEVGRGWMGNRLRLFLDIHPNLSSRHVTKGC